MASDQYPTSRLINDLNELNPDMLSRIKEIASLVTQAAEADNVEVVLERIAKVSAELVNAQYGALGVPDGMGGLRFFKVTGISDDQIKQIEHPPIGRGLLGAIMNDREIVRLEHMRDDARSIGFPEGHPPMDSLLGVPVMMGDQLHGMLYLTNRRDGQPFSDQDQWLIEVMASYAALALANMQLQEQRSRLAMLEERDRIGMELHDGVIQSIYAIGMQIELVRSTVNEEQARDLKKVTNGLNTVIEDIRSYIQNLRRMNEDGRTLNDCLTDLLQRIHIPDRLNIDIVGPDEPIPLPAAVLEAVCQIVHEALSNVVRHANATEVTISTRHTHDTYEVIIDDNGSGFDVKADRHYNGLGLRNIQQRARLHGGQVRIDSQQGEGTHLVITMPIRPF